MTTAKAASPDKLVNRSEAARMLGVSVSTLRRREGTELTPVVDANGVHMFEEAQVRSVMVTIRRRQCLQSLGARAGDLAADVFEMLDNAVHPVDIVKRLRVPPDVVTTLREQWFAMRGGFSVSAEQADAIRELARATERFANADEALIGLKRRLGMLVRLASLRGPRETRTTGAAGSCGPLDTVNVRLEHRGDGPNAEVRVCAGVYRVNAIERDGGVAELHSEWYSADDLESVGIRELVTAIHRLTEQSLARARPAT
jgi:hypothetical protein